MSAVINNPSGGRSNRPLDPRRYPIVIRVVEGYIEASQPDLGIYRARKKFDDIKKAEDIGNIVLDLMKEVVERYYELLSHAEELPLPSYPKGTLNLMITPSLSIRTAANLLGVSQDTVRRICADGQLRYNLTRGGHRRFSLAEIQLYQKSKSE